MATQPTPPRGTVWLDPDGRLWIDNTSLKATALCSTEAMIRYVWGYQGAGDVSAPLRSGGDGHEAMATYFRTWDADKALQVFADLYEPWAAEHVPDPDDRLSYPNVRAVLSAWFAAHPRHVLPFEIRPDLVEIPFAIEIADDVIFFGKMDLIAQNAEDTEWYIVDNKFTGRMDSTFFKKFRSDTQLSGYMKAAQEHTGRNVVGAFINAIELAALPDLSGVTKCRTHGVPYTTCAPDHTTKCRTHKVAWTECAAQHIRTCQTHDVPFNECADQHARWRIALTTRTPDQIDEWQKTAVSQARKLKSLMQRFPDISYARKLRLHGQFTDQCVRCGVADWCLSGRHPELVPTMLTYAPWRPWEYWKDET